MVHGVLPGYERAILGSLAPAMSRRGFLVDVRNVGDLVVDGPDAVRLDGVDLVCVTGSPDSVYDETLDWVTAERRLLQRVDDAHIPVLGVCFGAQILASALGGSVKPSDFPEHGFTTVSTLRPDLIAAGPWLEFHHDAITPPPGAEVIAATAHNVQAFILGAHLGVQFHPEITPECFVAWRNGYSAATAGLPDHGVDFAALAAEIEHSATRTAADCDELFGRFLSHAGL